MRFLSLQHAGLRNKCRMFPLAAIGVLLLAPSLPAQAKRYPLESTAGLRLHNVVAEPALLQGKKGLRITPSVEALRRLRSMTPDEQLLFPQLASIDGLEFGDGVIEAEIAGAPAPGAQEGRGYVGIAFRVQNEVTYDAFYFRPTNGRADDQERRNHAVQYISHPDWPFSRLRRENPSKYESYVDLLPGVWTKVKIEVRGERARLYVHDQEQPTLLSMTSRRVRREKARLRSGAITIALLTSGTFVWRHYPSSSQTVVRYWK
jgi:hypothetical protein